MTSVTDWFLQSGCFDALKVLALNKCHISSFTSILSLAPLLPSLEELYLAANKLDDLTHVTALLSTKEERTAESAISRNEECSIFERAVADVAGSSLERGEPNAAVASDLPSLTPSVVSKRKIMSNLKKKSPCRFYWRV